MKGTIRQTTVLVACVGVLSACAKHTHEIQAQYVSPLQYNSYKCSQIESEMAMVSRRASELGGQVEKTASDDEIQMGVGLVLLWPVLFALDGNNPQAAEYGRLKGEFEALEKAAIQKNCKIKVEPIVVKKPVTEDKDKPAYPSQQRNR